MTEKKKLGFHLIIGCDRVEAYLIQIKDQKMGVTCKISKDHVTSFQ